VMFPVSFGEDAIGNLYIAYIASGEVYRIATDVIPEPSAMLLTLMCIWPFAKRSVRNRI
jgi:hypothetical protein